MYKKVQFPIIIAMLLALLVGFGSSAQDEQVLRIATASSGASSFDFNVLQAGADQQNWSTFLFMPPMYFDANQELQPGVFNAWESNEDNTVWTFSIDPAAQWSDGTPIVASQIKGSWEIQAAPINAVGRATGYFGNIVGFAEGRDAAAADAVSVPMDGLVAVDDSTLEVTLASPDPIFYWRVATAHLSPARAEDVLEYGFTEYWKPENNPVFSGPFILESFDINLQTAEMVPNPNWWGSEGPYLDRVTFQFVPDPQIIGAMVLNDQVDASLAPIPSTMRDQVPDYFRPITTIGFNVFWLNPSVEPTSDINVRKALMYSVDWNAVFAATFPIPGSGEPTTQPMDPALNCYVDDMVGYPYDVEEAQAALAASSYGSVDNLPKMRVTPRGNNEFNNRALQAVMEFWRQNLGYENIEFQETPDGFGDDVALLNLTRDDVVIRFPDGATYMFAAAHSNGGVAGGSTSPLAGYVNEEIDALMDEALTISPDDPRRCELTVQAQELYVNDFLMAHFGRAVPTINARDYVVNYVKGPDVAVIEPWNIMIER